MFLPGGLCPGDLCQGVSVEEIPLYSEEQVVRILLECFLVIFRFLPITSHHQY